MVFTERSRSVAAGVLLGLIAALTVAGAVLLAAQERSRLKLVAEFRAFQLGSDLLRLIDSGASFSASSVEGLVGIGVYDSNGAASFRSGSAPGSVVPADALKEAAFRNGVVSFVRSVGGNPMRFRQGRWPDYGPSGTSDPLFSPGGNPSGGQGRGMMGGGGSPGLGPVPGMGMGMGASRFLYVAYDLSYLMIGGGWILGGSIAVIVAVAAATALLVSLVSSLGKYREREVRNKDLVALGEAARTLAHEIKNPLGVVKIQCAILRKSVDGDSLKGVRIIEEETDRLANLASRVKAFLSADGGTASVISVADLLASYADRYGASLTVRPLAGGQKPVVRADRLRIEQILDNLISNARESMDGTSGELPELSAEFLRGRVSLTVSDRGKGISPENADRVFDLFFTTKTSGVGLGLSLSKRYAEASGGSLSHRPRAGGGTEFILELPGANQ